MKSYCFFIPPILAALIAVFCPGSAGAGDRPNIVWIFVEDMNGWYGCYGDDTVPTRNIDALAKRGVRFDRAYMPAGVCSATRSSTTSSPPAGGSAVSSTATSPTGR